MSWASRRKTTRTEDIAYCMLGIFNVSMPFLCGEKGKAFIRLQEEIMEDSDDQTLFAWENEDISPDKWRGLLAYSPAEFENSGDIIQFRHSDAPFPFSVTDRGIVLQLPLATYPGKRTFRTDVTNRTRTFESSVYPDRRDPRLKIVILECLDTALGGPRLVGITLSRNPDQKSQYVRCGPRPERKISWTQFHYNPAREIYVAKTSVGRRQGEEFGTGDLPLIEKQPYCKPMTQTRESRKNLVILFEGNHCVSSQKNRVLSNLEKLSEITDGAQYSQCRICIKDHPCYGKNYKRQLQEAVYVS